jgi:hypothetical protein
MCINVIGVGPGYYYNGARSGFIWWFGEGAISNNGEKALGYCGALSRRLTKLDLME